MALAEDVDQVDSWKLADGNQPYTFVAKLIADATRKQSAAESQRLRSLRHSDYFHLVRRCRWCLRDDLSAQNSPDVVAKSGAGKSV